MKQSKKIAVTGGIGSGKSYVLAYIRGKGYPVFSCDEISRALWREKDYRKELASLFPQCAEKGEIEKTKLTELVFSDPAALARLEAFSHPRIMSALLSRMEGEEVSFAEVPLLFEGGYEHLFDIVLAVRRDETARMRAVMERDGLSEGEVRLRMSRQLNPSALSQKPCDIIENDGHLIENLELFFKKYHL